MRRLERVNVGIMLAGQGYGGQDVFAQAAWRWDKRQARALVRSSQLCEATLPLSVCNLSLRVQIDTNGFLCIVLRSVCLCAVWF
jgi:hypothetical protein